MGAAFLFGLNAEKTAGLLFKKTFDDGLVETFDLISKGKRSIKLQTIYMEKGDYTKKKFAKTPLLNKSTAHTSETRVGQTSTNSIPRFDSKNNISAKKISDNGNESDIENGLKSKDDTIYDDDFEQAWWDSVAGTLET